MRPSESPFRSPSLEPSADQPRLRENPYVLLVAAAIVGHVVTYAVVWFTSSLVGPLLNVHGPDPPAWIEPTLQVFIYLLLVMVPLSFLLGMTSVFLLWRHWDNWRGATIVALLAAIPVFTLVVSTYVLLRAGQELKGRHPAEEA